MYVKICQSRTLLPLLPLDFAAWSDALSLLTTKLGHYGNQRVSCGGGNQDNFILSDFSLGMSEPITFLSSALLLVEDSIWYIMGKDTLINAFKMPK